MKILLHIGQSKTGTSAIQAFLTLNRKRLLEEGVLYPTVSISGMTADIGNHNPLADSLVGLSRYPYLSSKEYFDSFFQQANQTSAKLMILSAEHFFGGEPRIWDVPDKNSYFEGYERKLRMLASYLNKHEVSILLYLRPQINWLASAISQTIRIERLISEKQIYLGDEHFFEMVKTILCYYQLVKMWDECLQPKEINIIPYERKRLIGQSSISDFLDRVGLGNFDALYGDSYLQINPSISHEFIEVKKILNTTIRSKNEERVIISCLETLTKQKGFSHPYQISNELFDKVKSFVILENELLNKHYMKEGKLLNAHDGEIKTLEGEFDKEKLNNAMKIFKKEFNHPRYRLLALFYFTKIFLRDHAKPLHTALHQLKRFYLKWRYKN